MINGTKKVRICQTKKSDKKTNKNSSFSINQFALEINRTRCEGVWIPKEIYFCNELSWAEKILFIELNYLSEHGKYGCCASNEYLSKYLNMGIASIQRYIAKFKEIGLIKESKFNGSTRFLKTDINKFNLLKSKIISQEHQTEKPGTSV